MNQHRGEKARSEAYEKLAFEVAGAENVEAATEALAELAKALGDDPETVRQAVRFALDCHRLSQKARS